MPDNSVTSFMFEIGSKHIVRHDAEFPSGAEVVVIDRCQATSLNGNAVLVYTLEWVNPETGKRWVEQRPEFRVRRDMRRVG